ncbi:MAG: hypothetical protein KF862_25245 [Chitinophagaceae bacterium]|nr:hypothetical protein [Chitinophagaceae bacterium]
MTRPLLTLSAFVLTVFSGLAQTDSLKFPNNAKLPGKFQKAIKEQAKEYDYLFYRDSATTKHYSVPFMLEKIDNDSNYHYILLAEYWIAFHYKDIIPDLIKRLTNKKEVGLANSADLIIWERVQAKQMQFYGHGGISNDDLFTIAGRANRLLTKITGEDFGRVSMYSTQEQLATLQKKWTKWLKRL